MYSCCRTCFFAVFLALWLAPFVRAQTENAAAPPRDVLAAMKPGGISLTYTLLPKGNSGTQAMAHLYVVPPKGQSPLGTPKGTPITRADIESGSTIPPSPYYLDIFSRAPSGALEHGGTATFTESGACNQLKTRWLEPDKKRGWVLLLRFGVGDNGVWRVYALSPDLNVLSRQSFGFAGDAEDYYINPQFDRKDNRGFMAIRVEEAEKNKKQTILYEWAGTGFADKKAYYFVLSSASKKRKEVEDYAAAHHLEDFEIIETSRYMRLAPGLFALVLARFREPKKAAMLAKGYQKEGVECYVKQAF